MDKRFSHVRLLIPVSQQFRDQNVRNTIQLLKIRLRLMQNSISSSTQVVRSGTMGAINVLLMMMPLLEHVSQQMFVLQTEENFVQSNYLQLNQQNLYLMNSKRKLSSSVKFGTTAVTIVKSDTAKSMDARRNHAQQEQPRLAKRRFQPQIW